MGGQGGQGDKAPAGRWPKQATIPATCAGGRGGENARLSLPQSTLGRGGDATARLPPPSARVVRQSPPGRETCDNLSAVIGLSGSRKTTCR